MGFIIGLTIGSILGIIAYAFAITSSRTDEASDKAYEEYVEALIREDKFKKEVIQQMDEIYRRRDDSNRLAGETEATEADDSGRIKQAGDPEK